MNYTVTMTTPMEKALKACTTEFGVEVVKALAEKYSFDEAEALEFLELNNTKVVRKEPKAKKEPKTKMVTPCMPLPFCGVVMDGWCKGIRTNHDLFTQCTMVPKNGIYCTTCAAQAESNDTDKPTHGNICDRMEQGDEWRSPAGKQPVNYGNVMEKKNIEKDAAVAEATAFGWEITEEQFEVKARKSGRPKSPASSDDEEDKPKKEKKVKKVLTEEEKVEKKRVAAEKRKEKAAKKKVEKEAAKVDTEEEVSSGGEEEVKKPKKEKKVKKVLTEEEKEEKKRLAAVKRKENAAKKKAEKEAAKVDAEEQSPKEVMEEEVSSSDEE